MLLRRDHWTDYIRQVNRQFTTQLVSLSEGWLKARPTCSSSAWVTRKEKDLVKKWKQLHQKQVIVAEFLVTYHLIHAASDWPRIFLFRI